ncbi:hypothetical protein [Vibrio algicola]|uniref:Lipoprotein n=1 Tax=Vibrio algicola TaxID=2662262 RepID=A0A5Q0TAP7_9VIBR|nr:hypothetical protein [Vibrio algicola]
MKNKTIISLSLLFSLLLTACGGGGDGGSDDSSLSSHEATLVVTDYQQVADIASETLYEHALINSFYKTSLDGWDNGYISGTFTDCTSGSGGWKREDVNDGNSIINVKFDKCYLTSLNMALTLDMHDTYGDNYVLTANMSTTKTKVYYESYDAENYSSTLNHTDTNKTVKVTAYDMTSSGYDYPDNGRLEIETANRQVWTVEVYESKWIIISPDGDTYNYDANNGNSVINTTVEINTPTETSQLSADYDADTIALYINNSLKTSLIMATKTFTTIDYGYNDGDVIFCSDGGHATYQATSTYDVYSIDTFNCKESIGIINGTTSSSSEKNITKWDISITDTDQQAFIKSSNFIKNTDNYNQHDTYSFTITYADNELDNKWATIQTNDLTYMQGTATTNLPISGSIIVNSSNYIWTATITGSGFDLESPSGTVTYHDLDIL